MTGVCLTIESQIVKLQKFLERLKLSPDHKISQEEYLSGCETY